MDLATRQGTAAEIGRELEGLAARTWAQRPAERLREALRRGCWIYGAGGYGRTILRLLGEAGIACRGFIDRRAESAAFAGIDVPVIAPAAIDGDAAAGTTLIVALHNYAADQAPVVAWARTLGFAEVIIPAELPDLLGAESGSYWLTGREHTAANVDRIVDLLGMLDDRRSIETVAAAARFRISGRIASHPAATIADQYFPRDLPLPAEPLRLIDGGAYIGDTYEAAVGAGAVVDEWYAFEPDSANFSRLAAVARAAPASRIALFPCGLGDRCMQVSFASGEAAGSHASAAGTGLDVAQIVALDEVLPGVSPNFVKLDIEGAEREALDGMRETIARARPHLALSIYHKPEDLWELPFKVREMMPEARLHVRQHGFNGFDTVLYAVQ